AEPLIAYGLAQAASSDVSSVALLYRFHRTANAEAYTLPLHDALPIWDAHRPVRARRRGVRPRGRSGRALLRGARACGRRGVGHTDRKSTRLNSSHGSISYAVFCLKKKNSSRRGSTVRGDGSRIDKHTN